MRSDEDILRAAYAAFNARDLEGALELMHPEVDWPNAASSIATGWRKAW